MSPTREFKPWRFSRRCVLPAWVGVLLLSGQMGWALTAPWIYNIGTATNGTQWYAMWKQESGSSTWSNMGAIPAGDLVPGETNYYNHTLQNPSSVGDSWQLRTYNLHPMGSGHVLSTIKVYWEAWPDPILSPYWWNANPQHPLTMFIYVAPGATCAWYGSATVINNTKTERWYGLILDNSQVRLDYGQGPLDSRTFAIVQPGQVGNLRWQLEEGETTNGWQVVDCTGAAITRLLDADYFVPQTKFELSYTPGVSVASPFPTVGATIKWTPCQPHMGTESALDQNLSDVSRMSQNTNSYQTNGPIGWQNSNTNPATEGSLKQGFGAVVDAIQTGLGELDDSLTALRRALAASTNGGTGGVTDMSLVENRLKSLTNEVARIGSILSTNDSGNYGMSVFSTNYDAAKTEAQGVLDDSGFSSGVDGWLSTANGGIGQWSEGSWGAVSVTLWEGGEGVTEKKITFDPFSGAWSGFADWSRTLAIWIYTMIYALAILRDIQRLIESAGGWHQFSIAKLDFSLAGFGGNLGALVAPVTYAAVLATYAGLLAVAGAELTAKSNLLVTLASDPMVVSDSNITKGIYLVNRFGGVSTGASYLGAYIIWRLTLVHATGLAAVIIKRLPG